MNEIIERLLAIENDIARNCVRGTEAAIEFHALEKEKLILQLESDLKFKMAIDTLFGTTDLNKLHSISESVRMIYKYVKPFYEDQYGDEKE